MKDKKTGTGNKRTGLKVLFVEAPESFYTRQGINDCVLESTQTAIQVFKSHFCLNKMKQNILKYNAC